MTNGVLQRLATAGTIFGTLAAASAASAEVVQIPAAAFAQQRSGLEVGLLRGVDETFYAALPLTGAGVICSLTMSYEDSVQAPGLKVSLLRKNVVYGGSAELRPTVLASVSSAPGTYNWVNKATSTAISEPRVNPARDHFYLKAEFSGDGGEDVGLLGVMVDVRKEC